MSEPKRDEEQVLQEARERFRICVDAEAEERKESLDDLKFVMGEQWPDEVKRLRGSRPTHTNNRMLQFVHHVVNEQRKSRPSITVSPIGSGADTRTASMIQGLTRHIERVSRAEVAYDNAFKYAVACGRGYFRITTDYVDDDSCDQEIKIRLIENPFTVYTDPNHHEPDAIDAEYRFVSEKIKKTAFKAKYKFDPMPLESIGEGDDNEGWFDDDEVRVAEYWRIVKTETTVNVLSNGHKVDGDLTKEEWAQLAAMGVYPGQSRTKCVHTVEQYLMTGSKIIKKSTWLGRYIPIITVSGGEFNVEGKKRKYSLIRFAKDAQRLDNYWSSTEAEMLALSTKAPFIAAEGTFDGHEESWAKANVQNLPYLEYTPVPGQPPPMRQPFAGTPVGVREARNAAIEDVRAIMGLHESSLGMESNEKSGVAIRERRNQGDTATYHFIDGMAKAIESAGRIIIDLIPKVYDTARTVRIVKPDEQSEMVAINQLFIDPQTGQPYEYDLAAGTYDVAVKVGPSFQTQREEAREAMLEFMRIYPQSAPVIGDLVAGNMDFPQAEDLTQRLKTMVPPQALGKPAPPDPMAQHDQMKMQMEQAQEQAKLQQIQQKGELDMQRMQLQVQTADQKTQMEMQVAHLRMQLDQAAAAEKRAQHEMEMQLKAKDLQLQQVMGEMKLQQQQMQLFQQQREAERNDALYMQKMSMGAIPTQGPPQTHLTGGNP